MLTCFGAEPVPSEADTPWCYVDSTYRTEADGFTVIFTVHPSYIDIEFTVILGDHAVYELKAIGAEDVRVRDFSGCDVFEIWLSKKEWLQVQLRPRFGITHRFERLPPWTGVADL